MGTASGQGCLLDPGLQGKKAEVSVLGQTQHWHRRCLWPSSRDPPWGPCAAPLRLLWFRGEVFNDVGLQGRSRCPSVGQAESRV